jgi:hypothetical protein
MALNIDIVNSTVINVYETGQVPRSYFGATGASGKFYPSGTSGVIEAWQVVSNTVQDAVDGEYNNVDSTTNGSGTNGLWTVFVDTGTVATIQATSISSGYGLGDFVTIQGSDLGGGTGSYIVKITAISTDGLLIVIGGDFYEVKWYNLVVGGTPAGSLSDAQSLLATLFSTL